MATRQKIGTGKKARYVRRDADGRFTGDQVNVGRSLTADRKKKAARPAKHGQGDKGDRTR